jgi:hypothetical protein
VQLNKKSSQNNIQQNSTYAAKHQSEYELVVDLGVDQGIVSPPFSHEVSMCTLLCHLTILNYRYLVCVLDGRQAMGDHDAGAALPGGI